MGRSWKTTPSPTLLMAEARGRGKRARSTLLFRGRVLILSDLLVGSGASSSLACQMAFCFASLIPFDCFYNYESHTWSLKLQAVSMYIVCISIYICTYTVYYSFYSSYNREKKSESPFHQVLTPIRLFSPKETTVNRFQAYHFRSFSRLPSTLPCGCSSLFSY